MAFPLIARPKTGLKRRLSEILRRRFHHLRAAVVDLVDGKAAFVDAGAPEAEGAVDADKAARIGEHLLGIGVLAEARREPGSEASGVIGERGLAGRRRPEGGLVALREGIEA